MIAWSRGAMASREELLRSIHPGMVINRAFFLKIYGYELSWPGFRDTAIKALEDAGCSKAREYYDSVVGEYEKGYREQMKEVGKWYLEECNKEWEKKRKEGEEKRRQEEIELLKRKKQLLRRKRQLLTEE